MDHLTLLMSSIDLANVPNLRDPDNFRSHLRILLINIWHAAHDKHMETSCCGVVNLPNRAFRNPGYYRTHPLATVVNVRQLDRELSERIGLDMVRTVQQHPAELFLGWIGTESLGGFAMLMMREEQRMFGGPAPPIARHLEVAGQQDADVVTRLQNSINRRVCAHCGAANPINMCSRCRQAKYCNRECQLADYRDHRRICRVLASEIP